MIVKEEEHKKLIADFMGWEDNGQLDIQIAIVSCLRIVEKIESFVYERSGCAKYNVIIEQSWVDIIDNHTSDEIVGVDADSKEDAVSEAVVEFIKWYNEQDRFICGVCGEHVNEYTYNKDKDIDECNNCK